MLSSYAQADSVFQQADSASAVFRQQLDSIDTQTSQAIDSLGKVVTRLIHLTDTLPTRLTRNSQKLDSVAGKASPISDPLNGKATHLTHLTDTLATDFGRYDKKLDSITVRLQFKIDSLTHLGQSADQYRQLLDSLNNLRFAKSINAASARLGKIKQRVNKPVNRVEEKINEKLSLMNGEGGREAGLPGRVNLPGVSRGETGAVHVTGLQLPGVPGNGMDSPEAPDLQLPDVNGGKTPLGNSVLPGGQLDGVIAIDDNLSHITSLPQQQLDALTNNETMEKAEGVLDGAVSVTEEIDAYTEDAQNIASGSFEKVERLPETIESEVAKLEDVQGLKKNMGEMGETLASGKDAEALKKEVVNKATRAAVNHFVGKGDQLKSAMQRVARLKEKYNKLNTLRELPKRPPNPMKNRPLVERLVPGLGLQLQYSAHALIDFNPYVGYRLSGRWVAGAGWVQRVAFDKKLRTYFDERFFGPRVYGQFGIGKGFNAYASVESLYGLVPPLIVNANVGEGIERWVWSAFVGLKRDYQLMKGVRGNFQFLYNVYDDHDQSPYADRLVVRMGFELMLKKKRKMPKVVSHH